ncbi:hypothetical protein Pr1d_05650 [Bythopirellula goksoeyrii]|uniref:Uncharacterized protein n=1 Tax=Bythopirellula goksoeyrii TaxID=1400387 RepID=A0A5B9Q2U6_9BACT|nr:hypothetical protein Pr1d_05650 [Bythopirellula goksoeyrii]
MRAKGRTIASHVSFCPEPHSSEKYPRRQTGCFGHLTVIWGEPVDSVKERNRRTIYLDGPGKTRFPGQRLRFRSSVEQLATVKAETHCLLRAC